MKVPKHISIYDDQQIYECLNCHVMGGSMLAPWSSLHWDRKKSEFIAKHRKCVKKKIKTSEFIAKHRKCVKKKIRKEK